MPNKRNAVGSPSRAIGKKRRTANRTGGQIMQNEEITQKKDGAGRRRIRPTPANRWGANWSIGNTSVFPGHSPWHLFAVFDWHIMVTSIQAGPS
ncbi:Hypothetical predicted protein [Mytilus galloprovincialis]|uniref:Uncharacterized protein n=1 Tax=Mytilus galloprovincialis TaxID=29158 RepID=A0A8B6DP82_MYTGA|nr:Hypothetical predicted protein [Mytilus galloprovincialis]